MPPKGRRKHEGPTKVEEMKVELKEEYAPDSCRVCLGSQTESGASLFVENARWTSLHLSMQSVASVRIAKDDGLPSRVCAPCLAELEAALAFKFKCETSDRILHDDFVVKEEELLPSTDDFLDKNEDEVHGLPKFEDEWQNDMKLNICLEGPKETDVTEVECHDCGEKFRTKCKLRVHWKKEHLPFAYICEHCKRVFASAKTYQKHKKLKKCVMKLVNVKIEGLGKERTFCCTKCVYTTNSSPNFYYHSMVHTKLKKYKCNMCESAFSQTSSLQSHKESKHQVYTKEVTCEFCGKLLKGKNKIYKHLLRHSLVKKYQCDECKKYMKTKNSLIQHLLRHGEKQFCCEICSKRFYTSPELENHKNYVHLKKKKPKSWHSCVICGFRSHNKFKIKKHSSKHTDSNHACHICGFFFQKENLYKSHMERHKVGRILPCPYCELTYSTRGSLMSHIKKKHFDETQPVTICKVEMKSFIKSIHNPS